MSPATSGSSLSEYVAMQLVYPPINLQGICRTASRDQAGNDGLRLRVIGYPGRAVIGP